MSLQITDEALALILEAEGLDQPGKWPGESSGITIGLGYDLGFASEFSDIKVKRDDAIDVFKNRTLPLYRARTEKAFPGVDQLPANPQGALVSLVFNRGPGMDGDRRKEMRAVRDAVAAGDLQEIADQIRAMKHLWDPNKMDGLLKRPDAEADLVESSTE